MEPCRSSECAPCTAEGAGATSESLDTPDTLRHQCIGSSRRVNFRSELRLVWGANGTQLTTYAGGQTLVGFVRNTRSPGALCKQAAWQPSWTHC
jgi:hypothetical protein